MLIMYFIIFLTTKIKKQIFYFVLNISHKHSDAQQSKNHVKYNRFKNIKNFNLYDEFL